jgi:hypothetical protein
MKKTANVWFMPAMVGLISTVGLVVALLADGWADVISVALLSLPAVLCIWLGYLKR